MRTCCFAAAAWEAAACTSGNALAAGLAVHTQQPGADAQHKQLCKTAALVLACVCVCVCLETHTVFRGGVMGCFSVPCCCGYASHIAWHPSANWPLGAAGLQRAELTADQPSAGADFGCVRQVVIVMPCFTMCHM
jgi:hypothetical protein